MERETGYAWDGSLEGKIWLIQTYEWTVRSETWREQTEASLFIFDLESKLLPVLAEMEIRWVRLDTVKLASIGERIGQGIKNCETEIYEVTGEFFNLNSPKQVAELLFGKLGIKPTKKNKTGYSVDTEVLEEIAKDYDVARLIIEHRTLSKLQSTYVESLLKVADKQTHRVHTTYSQLGAATGRMSSNDPNLQNIPTGIGYASEIKSCFIPSEGNIFLVADYSQIEIRVLAWLSQDSALLEAFEKWEDIHARTAKFLFGDSSRHPEWNEGSRSMDISQAQHDENQWKPTGEQRRIAKTVNFWVIYGITGFGLAKTLGAQSWEATKYIEAFYEKYPGVKSYYEKILEDGRSLW
jgi:DNA polymerase I